MQTTQERSRTASDALADEITQDILNARDAIPPAANGHTTRATDPRVAYHRSQIGAHKMQPIHVVLGIVRNDLKCRVPAAEHLAWIDKLRATVEAMAVAEYLERTEHVTPIVIARESIKETTLQGKADPAQERWTLDPDNVAACEAFITAEERHVAQGTVMLRLAHTKLALLKGGMQRRVIGAGRSA